MNVAFPDELYARWMALWNGDLGIAETIISPNCVVHQAPFSSSPAPSFQGPAGIRQMVEMGRSSFRDITFNIEVGPIASNDYLAARWVSHGTYAGGIPGATAEVGTHVVYHGMDMMRVEADKIAEYWVSADVFYLMAQLGAM